MNLIASAGHRLDQLFIVGSDVYVSSGHGPYAEGSTYAPLRDITDLQRSALLELLSRLGAEYFESGDALEAEVRLSRQWEAIYAELDSLLKALPFAAANGSPTYLIVDYGHGQHKIECEASEYFQPWSCPSAWCKSTARRELRCAVLSEPQRTAEWEQYR